MLLNTSLLGVSLSNPFFAATLSFHFKLISNTPHGGQSPVFVILDLFAEPFDVHVPRSGVAHIFIAPDRVEELLPGEHLVGR